MGKQRSISSNSYAPLKQLIIPIDNDPSSPELHTHKSAIVFSDCRINSRKTKASISEQLHKTVQITSCLWFSQKKTQTQMRMFGQHIACTWFRWTRITMNWIGHSFYLQNVMHSVLSRTLVPRGDSNVWKC